MSSAATAHTAPNMLLHYNEALELVALMTMMMITCAHNKVLLLKQKTSDSRSLTASQLIK